MRTRVAALATAVLTAAGMMAAFTTGPVSAAQPVPTRNFSAYSTGSLEHVTALQPGTTRVVNVDAPLSGAAVDSTGVKPIQNETNAVVVPNALADKSSLAGKASYARTGAAEIGLGTDISALTDQNQIILSKLVEASAPPSQNVVKDQLLEIPGDPLVYAKAAYEQATAKNVCALGQPISYGENALAKLQLIDAGAKNADNSMSQPVISVTPTTDPRTANFTKSYTYLFPNGDGTFGVASVTHMTVAPITLFAGMGANELTIELLGTWTLRVEASGKPGGAKVTFNPEANTPGTATVLDVKVGGVSQGSLSLNDILGKAGVTIPDNPLIDGTIATQPHAIGDETKPAVQSADGTTASAAVDILRLTVLGAAPQLVGAELRIGHMEGKASAAAGGIDCPLPVKKDVTPTAVTAPGDVTYTITVPSSIADFADIDCDLKDISLDDTASVTAAGPRMTLLSADHGGVVDRPNVGPAVANTGHITWGNIGNYKKGDPPIVVTVKARVPVTSGAGVINNAVTAHASLVNCKGGVLGQDFVGNALINGKAATINGSAFVGTANVAALNVTAATVAPARLAETGQREPWLPVVGGGLLLGALALMRSRRRLRADQA